MKAKKAPKKDKKKNGLHVGLEVTTKYDIDFPNGLNGKVVGVVKIPCDNDGCAHVNFSVPNYPKVCAGCGDHDNILFNTDIGQFKCNATGCGYEHGFTGVIMKIPVNQLVPYGPLKEAAERADWEREIRKILRRLNELQMSLNPLLIIGKERKWKLPKVS